MERQKAKTNQRELPWGNNLHRSIIVSKPKQQLPRKNKLFVLYMLSIWNINTWLDVNMKISFRKSGLLLVGLSHCRDQAAFKPVLLTIRLPEWVTIQSLLVRACRFLSVLECLLPHDNKSHNTMIFLGWNYTIVWLSEMLTQKIF